MNCTLRSFQSFPAAPSSNTIRTITGNAKLFRFGLPLAGGLYLTRQGGSLAESGVFGMIVVFYLITLAVETPLSLALLGADGRNSKAC